MSAKMIVLVLSILMPGETPDIRHMMKMQSMEACWDGAKDYMAHDMTDELRTHGAIGMSVTCAYQEMPSTNP